MSDAITFIQLPVDLRALYQLAAQRRWGGRQGFDEGRALHHALGEVFGAKALQPFRLMVPPGRRDATLYAYSPLAARELHETMELSPPDIQAVFNCTAMHDKQLPTRFQADRRLGFDIRICPVRRSRLPGKKASGKPREMDAFLHEALGHQEDEQWMKNNGRTREAVYAQWLAERLDGAALVERIRLASFRRTRKIRKGGGGVEGPDAIMQGTLQVKDTEAFTEKLIHGIGRHRAYGFGMILLRPAGQPPFKS